MGLDMYLNGKRYLSKYFNKEDGAKSEDVSKMFPELAQFQGRGESPVKEIIIEAGYWRKANAIHAWFVKNCQEGNDDCGNYYVGREQLQELRELCQRVVDFKHLANEQLPTASGFFFGDVKYDDWYFDYVARTIEIIDQCLALPESWDFEYHSSW